LEQIQHFSLLYPSSGSLPGVYLAGSAQGGCYIELALPEHGWACCGCVLLTASAVSSDRGLALWRRCGACRGTRLLTWARWRTASWASSQEDGCSASLCGRAEPRMQTMQQLNTGTHADRSYESFKYQKKLQKNTHGKCCSCTFLTHTKTQFCKLQKRRKTHLGKCNYLQSNGNAGRVRGNQVRGQKGERKKWCTEGSSASQRFPFFYSLILAL
jgi:hypothetical protein